MRGQGANVAFEVSMDPPTKIPKSVKIGDADYRVIRYAPFSPSGLTLYELAENEGKLVYVMLSPNPSLLTSAHPFKAYTNLTENAFDVIKEAIERQSSELRGEIARQPTGGLGKSISLSAKINPMTPKTKHTKFD